MQRKDGRAVEGARLESAFTLMKGNKGSNPFPSAKSYKLTPGTVSHSHSPIVNRLRVVAPGTEH